MRNYKNYYVRGKSTKTNQWNRLIVRAKTPAFAMACIDEDSDGFIKLQFYTDRTFKTIKQWVTKI